MHILLLYLATVPVLHGCRTLLFDVNVAMYTILNHQLLLVFPAYIHTNIHTVLHKTLAGENFDRVGTARKLAEKTLVVSRGKAHSIFELTRPHNFLADKTLAD